MQTIKIIIQKETIKSSRVPEIPTPDRTLPLPRIIELLYTRSVVEAATLVIQGLNERTVFCAGPVFPTAWITETPALVAKSSSISSMLRKEAGPEGIMDGPIDKLRISTPSSTALNNIEQEQFNLITLIIELVSVINCNYDARHLIDGSYHI
jgi:hypothetical protein